MTIWYTLWPFALFYGNFVSVVAIRYIIHILVYCVKKNLATPGENHSGREFANNHFLRRCVGNLGSMLGMNINFCDFRLFSLKKTGMFLKNQCYDQIKQKLAVI
jgi:hypothetical protein